MLQQNFRPQFLPPKPKPIDVKAALITAYLHAYHQSPPSGAVELLMAHQALETGWWGHMPNYNLGGIRPASEDQLWTAFTTFEDLPEDVAAEWVKASTHEKPCELGVKLANGKRRVNCKPNHDASVFRAFDSLDDGVRAYFDVLSHRFSSCWTAVLSGDPAAFVHALKSHGYFTADEQTYQQNIVSLFRTMSNLGVANA